MRKNPLEWTVFAVSCVLILLVLAVLILDARQSNGNRPSIELTLGQPDEWNGHYRLPVTVINQGNESAEGVRVEVTLTPAGGEEETADIEFQFVPRESQRRGWVVFTADPAAGKLEGRILGYEKP